MWWKSVWFQTHPYSYHSWGSPCSFFLPTLPSDSAKSARRLLSTISGAGWGALEEVWSRPGLGGLCGAISGTEPWFDRLCLRTGTEGGSPFILNFKIHLLELQCRQKSNKKIDLASLKPLKSLPKTGSQQTRRKRFEIENSLSVMWRTKHHNKGPFNPSPDFKLFAPSQAFLR